MNAYLKQYVEALTSLIASGVPLETILQNTRSVMKQRGHERLYGRLLRHLERVVPTLEAKDQAVLVVAKRDESAVYKETLGIDDVVVKTDHSIIGGYVLTKHNVRQDNSYKTKLLTWYRRSIDDIKN